VTQDRALARANARRRRRLVRRIAFAVIAVVILVPVLAISIFVARFDPNAYKPEIEQAVDKALGRQLALNGPLSLALSFTPTISAEDVALANPPGFSDPEMATLKRLDAQLSLLPLLGGRLAIRRIVLVQPVIAVEINRAGETNLSFAGAAAPRSTSPSPSPAPAAANTAQNVPRGRHVAIDVRAIRITDGKLSWQDDRTGRHGTLALASFTANSASDTAPMKLAATANYAGLPFTLSGQTGSLARLAGPLAGPGGNAPWPVQLAFTLGAAQASLDGNVADPAVLRGYQFHLQADLPALEALSPLFPGRKLPALHDVKLAANLADSGTNSGTKPGTVSPELSPEFSNVSIEAGKSDLGTIMPGLALSDLSFTAPALDQPCKLMLAGDLGATPFSVSATLGPPAALLPAGFGPPPPATPWPVAIQAAGAGANLAISGSVTRPESLAGASLAVSIQVPDLAALSPLAARKLPSLAQVSFSGQITDAETGWRQWVRLSDFTLTMPQGDLSGDATLALSGARPALTAALTSKRLDLDALRAAMKPAASGPAPAATAPPAPPPVPPSSESRSPARLIPDTPLPFAALRVADADLTLGVGSLITGGITYGNLAGKLVLKDGSLTLAPFGVQAPGGHVALTAAVNAAAETPPVSLTIDAPALALAPLLAAFGEPAEASGTVQLQARLSGAGNTAHAIASRLNGSLGVAMAGGSVSNDVIRHLLGSVLRTAQVPPALLGSGQSEVRCFAARFDATNGFVDLRTFLLETGRLTVTGGGGLALGQETLALRLDPSYQYGNGAISLPVRVNGTFLGPKIAPDVSGAISGSAKPNGLLAEILGALHGGSSNNVPDCGPALELARFGASGPAAPPPAPPPASGGKSAAPNNPLNLLRGLFHQ